MKGEGAVRGKFDVMDGQKVRGGEECRHKICSPVVTLNAAPAHVNAFEISNFATSRAAGGFPDVLELPELYDFETLDPSH